MNPTSKTKKIKNSPNNKELWNIFDSEIKNKESNYSYYLSCTLKKARVQVLLIKTLGTSVEKIYCRLA